MMSRLTAVAAGALMLCVPPACSLAGDTSSDTTVSPPTTGAIEPAPSRPVDVPTARDLVPHADVVRRPDGVMAATEPTLLLEAVTGSALFAFESPTNGACVQSAVLRAQTTTTDLPRIEAWVSVETEVAQLPDGTSLGGAVVAPGSPTVNASSADGVVTWDVTELVAWAATEQPDSQSLVVAVKPVFRADRIPIELGSMEGGRPATLTIVSDDSC